MSRGKVKLKKTLRGYGLHELVEGAIFPIFEESTDIEGGVWVELPNFRYAELAPDEFIRGKTRPKEQKA